MRYEAETPEAYIEGLPDDRRGPMEKLRAAVLGGLPQGFSETMAYGMISYVVPHSLYPAGYHVNPKDPLPFVSIASQKAHVALYHMALYSDQALLDWFLQEYPKHTEARLDMGKSCIRFRKLGSIPNDLIRELCGKLTVNQWVELYESGLKRV